MNPPPHPYGRGRRRNERVCGSRGELHFVHPRESVLHECSAMKSLVSSFVELPAPAARFSYAAARASR